MISNKNHSSPESKDMKPITRICIDCGKEFTISIGEQSFFVSHNFQLPKRCKDCRRKRKEEHAAREAALNKAEPEKRVETFLSHSPYKQIALSDIPAVTDHSLYIIGNGFDIIHGVKSSYWNFQSTLGKNSSLRFALETYLSTDDLWGNFEESLGHLNAGGMLDMMDMWLDNFDAYDPDAQAADYFAAIDTAMGPANTIMNELPKRFRKWIEKVEITNHSKSVKLNTRAEFLNFNYTEFLETEYGVNREHILYIHGCRKDRDPKSGHRIPIVLGHAAGADYGLDNYSPSKDLIPHYKDPVKEYLLESAMDTGIHNEINWYEQTFTKKTDDIIAKNIDWFDSHTNMDAVVVIGHSLSRVDWPYLIEIVKRGNNNKPWYVSWHSEGDLVNIKKFCESNGINDVTLMKS